MVVQWYRQPVGFNLFIWLHHLLWLPGNRISKQADLSWRILALHISSLLHLKKKKKNYFFLTLPCQAQHFLSCQIQNHCLCLSMAKQGNELLLSGLMHLFLSVQLFLCHCTGTGQGLFSAWKDLDGIHYHQQEAGCHTSLLQGNYFHMYILGRVSPKCCCLIKIKDLGPLIRVRVGFGLGLELGQGQVQGWIRGMIRVGLWFGLGLDQDWVRVMVRIRVGLGL